MKLLRIAAAAAMIAASGCMTVTVDPTKAWEGRYGTQAEAAAAVEKMQLLDGESVWILSSTTLKRVLKNAGK